jgi:hypothetical protein
MAEAGKRSNVVFDVLEDIEQAKRRYAGRCEADIRRSYPKPHASDHADVK